MGASSNFVYVSITSTTHKPKTKSMNKAELIDAMAADAGISKAAAKKALDSFTENITNTLASNGRVSLVGFGSFAVSERAAREGRNPQTGATIKIEAKKVARFKPGAELNDRIKTTKKK